MKSVLFLVIGIVASGCINRATATWAPGADAGKLKSFYVAHQPRDKDNLHQMISDQLALKGMKSTYGPEMPAGSYKTDAVITYIDKWMWDITLYLLELTVTVRDPTGQALAVGNSYHTSLTRLSPQEMVAEVMGNIFAWPKEPPSATAVPNTDAQGYGHSPGRGNP
jgi:hypothetical protein